MAKNTGRMVGKALTALCYSTAAYFALATIASISTIGAPKIHSQKELEQLVEAEKKELGCNKKIKAMKVTYFAGAKCGKIKGTDEYGIELGIGHMDIAGLKHEIYHICDGHIDAGYSTLGYWLWYEPQAKFYAGFGWKL